MKSGVEFRINGEGVEGIQGEAKYTEARCTVVTRVKLDDSCRPFSHSRRHPWQKKNDIIKTELRFNNISSHPRRWQTANFPLFLTAPRSPNLIKLPPTASRRTTTIGDPNGNSHFWLCKVAQRRLCRVGGIQGEKSFGG